MIAMSDSVVMVKYYANKRGTERRNVSTSGLEPVSVLNIQRVLLEECVSQTGAIYL